GGVTEGAGKPEARAGDLVGVDDGGDEDLRGRERRGRKGVGVQREEVVADEELVPDDLLERGPGNGDVDDVGGGVLSAQDSRGGKRNRKPREHNQLPAPQRG